MIKYILCEVGCRNPIHTYSFDPIKFNLCKNAQGKFETTDINLAHQFLQYLYEENERCENNKLYEVKEVENVPSI